MNSIKNIISLILFIIFFVSFILKLVILYKRNNINANVLAKGKKIKNIKHTEVFVRVSTLIWGITWLILSIEGGFITNNISMLFDSSLISLIGIIFTFIGVMIFMVAMISMKTSWRVGIDKTTKTNLVTYGIYKYSRNPAFVGFDIMFIGLFFMYPYLLTISISILNIFALHMLILQEEKHLKLMFGEEYVKYCTRTPRYFLFL